MLGKIDLQISTNFSGSPGEKPMRLKLQDFIGQAAAVKLQADELELI
jgi:hypothetical protein